MPNVAAHGTPIGRLIAMIFAVVIAAGVLVPTAAARAADTIEASLTLDQNDFAATPFTWGPFVHLTTPGSITEVNPQIWDGEDWVFVDSFVILGQPQGTGAADKNLVSTGAANLLEIIRLHQGRTHALPGEYSIRFVLPPRSGSLGMGTQDQFGRWSYPRASFTGATSDVISVAVSKVSAQPTGWPGGEIDWVQEGTSAWNRIVDIDIHPNAVVDVDLERSVDGRTWESVRTYKNGPLSWSNHVTFPTQVENTRWRLHWRGSEWVEPFVSDVYTVRTYPAAKAAASMDPAVVIKGSSQPAKMRVTVNPALAGTATPMSRVDHDHGSSGTSVGRRTALKEGVGYVDLELDSHRMNLGAHRVRVNLELDDYPVLVESNDVMVTVVPRAVVTVEGTPRVGATLAADPGEWPNRTNLSFQWYSGYEKVAGATRTTFTPREADRGKVVHVAVTGTINDRVLDEVRSEPTNNVDIGRLTTATPKIAGTAKVGLALTAKAGAWTSGAKLSYQWYVAGKAVPGATKVTFVPRSSDAGKTVKVKVTGKKAGYTTVAVTSKASGKVAKASKLKTVVPKISGTAKVGLTLTAKPGAWTSGTKLSYQWYVSGKAVPGATKVTFVPRGADAGEVVTVKVTGKKAGFTTAAVTSKASGEVAKAS